MARYRSIFVLFSLCSLLLNTPYAVAAPTSSRFEDGRPPHYDYGEINISLPEKRQSSDIPYITTGVTNNLPTDGSMPLRLEIRELQKNTEQWNLYILALDMLQYTDQSELLSWYEIAGK